VASENVQISFGVMGSTSLAVENAPASLMTTDENRNASALASPWYLQLKNRPHLQVI